MKNLSFFVILVVVLSLFMGEASVTAKEAPQLIAKSEIAAVTVFVRGARIYRHAEVALKKGEQAVVFEGFSTNLIDDSVRVLFEGSPKARISGIDIQTESTFRLIETETNVLLKKKVNFDDQIKMLMSVRSGHQAEIDFASGIIQQMKNSENMTQDVKKLKEMMTFVRETIKSASDEINIVDKKIRDIMEEIVKVDKEMKDLRYRYPSQQKNLIIRMTASEAEKVSLIMSYITPDASWKPSYDVRYVSEKKKVEIISYGVITQNTKENWDNVELTLSTAEATATVALPKFLPRVVHLGKWTIEESIQENQVEMRQNARFMNANSIQTKQQMFANNINDWEQQSRSYFTGKLSRLLGTIVFQLEEKRTINGDSRPHRTMLNLNEFDAEMDYFARPAISEFVYYHANLENTSKTPLLEGEMNIFVDSKFIGKWDMEPVAPGDKFEVFFGTVNELKIKRDVVKVLTEAPDKKNFRSSNLLTREMRITVENFFDKEVEVKIMDSIPVSWTDEVKVKLPVITPESKPDELGRLFWTLKIAPSKKSAIEYTYVIEYPDREQVKVEQWSEERYAKQKEAYKESKK